MAKQAVVDRMIVELIGDGSSYKEMMQEAKAVTNEVTKQVDGRLRDSRGRFLAGEQKLQAELAQTSSMLGRVALSARHYGDSLSKTGMALSFKLGLPLKLLGLLAIKTGSDFESGFAGVRKTVSATEPEFARLRSQFKALSTEIPIAVEELLRIGESAGQLGIQTDKIIGFTKTIAMIGVTTNLSVEEAAETFARFANITGMSQDKFENLGSAMVALGNRFPATEQDISSMAMRLASAGTTVGMTVPQILSLSTALSSVGLQAEMGGSAFSTFMLDITSEIAQGGEKVMAFANTAGMSAEKFSEMWSEKPVEAMMALLRGLNKLDKGAKVMAMREMGIDSVRMSDAVGRASNAVDVMSESLRIGGEAFEENEALAKEAEERFKTFASQVTLLKNNFKILLGEAFEIMRPTLMGITEDTKSLITGFQGLSSETKGLTVTVLALLAALGPGMFLLGKLLVVFGPLVKGVTLLLKGIRTLGLAMVFFGSGVGKAGLALLAFKGFLIASAIAMAAGIAKELLNLVMLTDKYNDELERGNELERQRLELQSNRASKILQEANAIEDLGQREKFLSEQLKIAKKDATGLNNQFNHLKKTIGEKDEKFWKNWSDNIELEVLQEELKEVEGNFGAAKGRVQELQKAINEVRKEKQAQEKATGAAGDKIDIEKEKERAEREKQRAKAIRDTVESLKEEAETYGMTEAALTRYRLTRLGASEDVIKEAVANAEAVEMRKKQTEAIEEQNRKEEARKSSIVDTIRKLREQKETFGLSAEEVDVYKLKQSGATESQIQLAQSLADQIAKLDKDKEAKEEAKKATDEAREAEKRFRDSIRGFGVEASGRGVESLARIQESRNLMKRGRGTAVAVAKSPLPLGAPGTNPQLEAKIAESQRQQELLLLQTIAESTTLTAKKDPIEFKAAGIGGS